MSSYSDDLFEQIVVLLGQVEALLPGLGGGEGTPATPFNSVQFNNAGTFGGNADLTFVGGALSLGATLASPVAGLYVGPGTYVDGGNEPSVQIDPLNTNPNAYWAVEIGPIFTPPTKAGELIGIFYGAQINRGVASGDDADRFFGSKQYVSLSENVKVTHEVSATQFYFIMNGSGSAEAGRGAWFYPPILSPLDVLPTYQAIWIDALGTAAPNSYYFWADSQGVYRIREDSVADTASFPQAIPALYNPRFTKYTPGAANYERGVQQWVSDVYQIGAQAGGTGTSRAVQIIGASVSAVGNLSAANLSGTNTGDQTTISGNAGTATALATARAINGVNFNGTAAVTVTAAAGTLSGATLAAGVTASSLTSFGVAPALGAATAASLVSAGSVTGSAFFAANIAINWDNAQQLKIGSTGSVGWCNTTGLSGSATADLSIFRDAASIHAWRTGATAQASRLYNTFTTVLTVGEWWKTDWKTTTNQLRFGTCMGTSTGSARVSSWDYGALEASPTAAITVPAASGNIVFGGGVQLSNAAVTGLSAGVLAATTNASIVLYDSGGQAYRVPCII